MRRALALAALVIVAPATASATAAVPRPLERTIEDADLVVVVKLRTKPAHPGDPFDADVEEVLRGTAPKGPVRVRATSDLSGCVVPRQGTPQPLPAIEGRGDRVLLFLDAEKDGARDSRDPVVLADGEFSSSWIYDRRPAALAVAAARALVAVDAEPDPERAVAVWVKGLASENALLVTALLHRTAFTRAGGDDQSHELGPRLAPRVRGQLAAGRAKLLPAVASLVKSPDDVVRRIAFQAAQAFLPCRDDAERTSFDVFASAAKAAARFDLSRGDAVQYLAAARDPALARRVVAALKARPLGDDVHDLGWLGREFFTAYPDREDEVLGELVALLDVNEKFALAKLSSLTGKYLGNAEMWRAWWKERQAAKPR